MFNRDMLQLARAARGFTQEDAARTSGVTQALISKIENGLSEPSAEVIEALSRGLDFPVDFFCYQNKIYGLPQYHYRKRAKLGVRVLQKIEADINIQRIHIERLMQSFDGLKQNNLPTIDLDEKGWTPQSAARYLRGHWMVPSGPVSNITGLLEDAGVLVMQLDFGTHLLDAMSFRIPGLPPLIFMNRYVPGDRYRFTLAHEVAHLILHNAPMSDDDMEDQADKFAAEFLMPAVEIRPYLKYPSLGKLARVKTYWKVSIKALIYNAFQLKLITPSQYRGLNVNYSKAGYSKGEPFPIEVEEPRLLPRMIDYHMRELGYSLADMAKLLFLEPHEVQRRYLGRPQLHVVK
jgi:Zn-dependent peptidase ImmA (M78 family)/DNA-binding XRE family transcriptional regulator